MSIKFVCACGKRLKARDEMAGKRIPCPRCGNPVGVPSLDPNHPTPMTPAERLRAKARRPIALSYLDDDPAPIPAPKEEPEAIPDREEVEAPTGRAEGLRSSIPARHQETDALRLPEPRGQPGVPSSPAGRSAQLAVAPPNPFNPSGVRQKRQRQPHRQLRARYEWPLETRWYQCLGYPFRAWPLVLGLTLALTVFTVFLVLIVPQAVAETPLDVRLLPLAVACLVPLTMLGYACGFLDCVLASAAAGEARFIRWPGGNLLLVFRSLVAWTLAFLSAPAPLAVIGFYYWLYCGDVQLVDEIILAELGLVGAGYWLLAVLAVTQGERLRDANPWRVAELAEQLGWRALVAAFMAGVLFLSHGLLAFWTAGVLHSEPGLGLLLAAGCWLSWMYWATFVFRVVGVWWYYRRV